MSLPGKIRGIVGSAVTWALAWIPLGLVLSGIGVLTGGLWPIGTLDFIVRATLTFGAYGALSGAIFGTAVAVAERRHRLRDIPRWRFAVLGVLAALAPPALAAVLVPGPSFFSGMSVVALGLVGVLGGATSTATLAMARRADALPAAARELALPPEPGRRPS
jgi:hypothetical protein